MGFWFLNYVGIGHFWSVPLCGHLAFSHSCVLPPIVCLVWFLLVSFLVSGQCCYVTIRCRLLLLGWSLDLVAECNWCCYDVALVGTVIVGISIVIVISSVCSRVIWLVVRPVLLVCLLVLLLVLVLWSVISIWSERLSLLVLWSHLVLLVVLLKW